MALIGEEYKTEQLLPQVVKKMPRAKKTQTTTTKKKALTLKQQIKQEVQKQLEEALLNIEIDTPESEVDLSSIKKEIKNQESLYS